MEGVTKGGVARAGTWHGPGQGWRSRVVWKPENVRTPGDVRTPGGAAGRQLLSATAPMLFTLNVKLFVSFFSVTAIVSSSTRENESSRLRPFGFARR